MTRHTRVSAQGFSIVELMVSLALGLVLISLALTSFQASRESSQFGDLDGNVWRVDMKTEFAGDGSVEKVTPTLTHTAELAQQTKNGKDKKYHATGDRRFFYAPDVAFMQAPGEPLYLGVVLGSGRRDHLLGSATRNRLYALNLDPKISKISKISTLIEDDLFDASGALADAAKSTNGWFIELKRNGEKMLRSPAILDGRILATTYEPNLVEDSLCEPKLGKGHFYVVDAFTAAGKIDASETSQSVDEDDRSRELESGGSPPPVSILVSKENVNRPVALVGLENV